MNEPKRLSKERLDVYKHYKNKNTEELLGHIQAVEGEMHEYKKLLKSAMQVEEFKDWIKERYALKSELQAVKRERDELDDANKSSSNYWRSRSLKVENERGTLRTQNQILREALEKMHVSHHEGCYNVREGKVCVPECDIGVRDKALHQGEKIRNGSE